MCENVRVRDQLKVASPWRGRSGGPLLFVDRAVFLVSSLAGSQPAASGNFTTQTYHTQRILCGLFLQIIYTKVKVASLAYNACRAGTNSPSGGCTYRIRRVKFISKLMDNPVFISSLVPNFQQVKPEPR